MRDTTIFGQILDRALFYHWKLQREGDSENTSSSNKAPSPTPGCPSPTTTVLFTSETASTRGRRTGATWL